MVIVAYVIIGLYTLALVLVTLYCLMQFNLLVHYRQSRKSTLTTSPLKITSDNLPFVTIQLPVYNERFVTERLIDNIVRLDYPKDKFEIQILDDSTDDTSEICKNKSLLYHQRGYNIHHVQRNTRDGFKAGAMQHGLTSARGEFIAIFDADFLPDPDFLLKTIPHFADPSIGVVQTRWDHINETYSLITRLQAFQLNVHFTVEQSGRQQAGHLLQFNGTAGVWRRDAITDAGGWRSDTLTEDLDLSFRAQLRGWKIKYMENVTSPAELPCEMSGLKSQQFRWMKGGAENARMLLPIIVRSKLPFPQKIHAINHLLSSSVFVFVFLLGVLSVPVLFLAGNLEIDLHIYAICMVGLLATSIVYFIANEETMWAKRTLLHRMLNFCVMFPLFLAMSMGLSMHNSIAVVQGFTGKKSLFVRTPKFNIISPGAALTGGYRSNTISVLTLMEGLMAIYFMIAIIMSFELGKTSFIIYHLMLMLGFGSIFIYSIRHAYQH